MARMLIKLCALAAVIGLALAPAGDTAPGTRTVTVDASSPTFLDTGVTIGAGEQAVVTATGDATCKAGGRDDCPIGPQGAGPSTVCANFGIPPGPAGPDVPYGSLAGRLGTTGKPFYVGAGVHLASAGRLYLIFNDCQPPAGYLDNAGKLTVTISVAAAPQQGRSVVVAPLSGTVRIRAPGSTRFKALGRLGRVAVGSEIDATAGAVAVTSAQHKPVLGESAAFAGGRFRVDQTRRSVRTAATLTGTELRSCPRTAGTSANRKPVRRLFGSGKGAFTTVGRYGSATVRGTQWLVEDYCDRTVFTDVSGKVDVRDTARRRTIHLLTGQHYTARRPA